MKTRSFFLVSPSSVEPFAKMVPLFEPKSIQLVNQEAGEKRRQHYCEALKAEAINKYYPLIQEVCSMHYISLSKKNENTNK